MRRRIAVITARADASEQRDILYGISEAAFRKDTDVAVYSNIYNHWQDDDLLNYENIIYSLFEPDLFDGVIVTAEAFRDITIINDTIDKIRAAKIPAIVIDGEIDGFKSVYSDDETDLEKMTEHLITVHGFTDIDILTGNRDNATSQRRLNGCKRAFGKHGISLDNIRVYYGNFWNDSGEELARRYEGDDVLVTGGSATSSGSEVSVAGAATGLDSHVMTSHDYAALAELVKASFCRKFWWEEKGCLYDVVDGDEPDDHLRPNQIYAVSLPFTMLSKEQEAKIVAFVKKYLYIGCGLRSLTSDHADYHGIYCGSLPKRDAAYHQGTAWGFLLGGFLSAYAKVHDHSLECTKELLSLLGPVRHHLTDNGCIGSISEIFDGDAPHNPRGCYAQAWSVGETLRAYMQDVLPYM